MPSTYMIPKSATLIEHEVKKSRFVGLVNYVTSRDEAIAFVKLTKTQYPEAAHHCWAYLIGSPRQPTALAMCDDGEPNGTAGKPILNVLQHKNVGDIILVVVRYFGGIKLGTGGLVRAYSVAAQQVIDTVKITEKIVLDHYRICGGYGVEQYLRHWLRLNGGQLIDVNYPNHGEFQVQLTVAIKREAVVSLTTFVHGQRASFEVLEQ